jgi:GNAT superfamily N-acetyltransferase
MGPSRERARWRERLPQDGVWVAEVDGQVVGYASEAPARRGFEPGFAGEIVELYLVPEMIGHGLGRALFDRARRSLAEQGFLWLVVDVLEANASARRFYERQGLCADGTGWWDRWRGARLRVLRYAGTLNAALEMGGGLGGSR